jgi:hypothetical protein
MSQVYASLGCAAKCGRCAHSIKIMLQEIKRFAAGESWRLEPERHLLTPVLQGDMKARP